MKSFPLFALAMICLTWVGNAQENRVADYYLNTPEKYLGKQIMLNCASVERESDPVEGVGILFRAYTSSARSGIYATGFIDVLVPVGKADAFATRYGFESKYADGKHKVKPLVGIFKKYETLDNRYYLEVAQ